MTANTTRITPVKMIPSKSPSTTLTLCLDGGLPSRGFRLRRRRSKFTFVKVATDRTYYETTQKDGNESDEVDRWEGAFRTPVIMKSTPIPPALKLPSFDDGENHDELPSTCTRSYRRPQDFSSVRMDLNELFDSLTHVSEDES